MNIPVFYDQRQIVSDMQSQSPSAMKPAAVLASWKSAGFPFTVHAVKPATVEDFNRAHDPEHVRAVLACEKDNGFENRLSSVAKSLPWTSGSLLSAARYLLETKSKVAVSPTSGFHHATYDACNGFCTFNGLMVAVLALRAEGHTGRIGILDLDEHFGDGTADILARNPNVNVEHYTYGGERLKPGQGRLWVEHRLPGIMKRFKGCSLVIYQAGADPHEHDPISRQLLSDADLAQRDRTVFRHLHKMGVPVVWNLAGGYQTPLRKVLDIHDHTMRACVAEYIP